MARLHPGNMKTGVNLFKTMTTRIMDEIKVKGLVIKTKFLGPTDYKDPRAKAFYKKDANTIYSKVIPWNTEIEAIDNYANATRELLKTEYFKDFHPEVDILSIGWDHDTYYFIVQSKTF